LYEPLVIEVGIRKVLDIRPLLFEIAGVIVNITLPFVVSQYKFTDVPDGK